MANYFPAAGCHELAVAKHAFFCQCQHAVQFAYLALLTAALVLIQCLIGGTRLAYSFPAYALVGLAAGLSLFSFRKPTVKPAPLCLYSTLLLAGYVVVRAWFSPNAYLSQADAFLAVGALGVYLLTALYLPQTLHRNWLVGALFAVAIAHIIVGALQFKDGAGFMLFGFTRGGAYGSRASGMLVCPNHLAGFLEAMALLALSIAFWGRWRLPTKMAAGYMALFCFVGVAMTGSRGGYLSCVVGLLAFAALSLWIVWIYDRQRFVLTVVATVLAVGLLLTGAVQFMQHSTVMKQRMSQIETASEDIRWYNWLAAIDQFKTSPLLGTGAGTHLYYGRLFRRPQIQVDPEHSHNDYLEMLAEYGIVGEALAIFFLVVHIARGLALARQVTTRRICNIPGMGGSDTLALLVGGLSAVAALLAHSVVDFNLHIPGNALLFAFFFAVLGSSGMEKISEERASRPEAFARGVLALAGMGLLATVTLRYEAEYLSNRARVAFEHGELEECTECAERAIEKNPANPQTYFFLGEACRATGAMLVGYETRQNYFNQAIEAYRKGINYFPQNENLWIRLGQCLDATEAFDQAQQAYLNAIASDPNLGILYGYYAAHLRLVGDLEGAGQCDAAARELGAVGLENIGMGEEPSLRNSSVQEKSSP